LNFTFLLPYIQIVITFILYFTIIYYFIKYNIYLYKNFYKIYILDLSINIILVLLLNYTLYNQKLTLVCINKLFFQNDSNLFLKFILENRMFILCFKFMYICLLNFLLFLVNYITLRGFFKYLYLKVHFFRYFIISIYEYIIFVNNLLKKFFKNYFLYKYFILFIDFLIYYDKIAVPGRYEVYLTIGIVIIFNLLNPFKLNVG